jgi:hypothetical protein
MTNDQAPMTQAKVPNPKPKIQNPFRFLRLGRGLAFPGNQKSALWPAA